MCSCSVKCNSQMSIHSEPWVMLVALLGPLRGFSLPINSINNYMFIFHARTYLAYQFKNSSSSNTVEWWRNDKIQHYWKVTLLGSSPTVLYVYLSCRPLFSGGFHGWGVVLCRLLVDFRIASHSGSYSRPSDEPGLSWTSTICNTSVYIIVYNPLKLRGSVVYLIKRSLTCRNSLWGRHLSSDRNLVTRGAALAFG